MQSAASHPVPQTVLVSVHNAIFLVSVSAVRTSAATDPNGILIFGRKLASTDTDSLAVLTGDDVALYSGTQLIVASKVAHPSPDVTDLQAVITSNSEQFNQANPDYAIGLTPLRNNTEKVIGTLVIWRPRTALNASQLALRSTLLLAFVVGALLAIGVAFLLGRSIVRPLNQMATIADQIAQGNLKQRIGVAGAPNDELTQLANYFNRMTTRLAGTIDDLNQKVIEIDAKNAELQVANAKAEELIRIRSEFLATMSHELRTPLNAIIGFADLLLMGIGGSLTDKQEHHVTRLLENAKRLLVLINDVLDISRLEAGRTEIVAAPFAPAETLDRVAHETQVLAEQKQLTFITNIAPDLPPTIIGDNQRIEQVVVNLLSNAIKFTKQGTVTMRAGVNGEQQWWISVADTGIGIPPHAIDLIFEPFRQLDGGYNRVFQGSGLGLAIAQQLVQAMGGTITVESELEKGSTFTVTLPIRLPKATGQIKSA